MAKSLVNNDVFGESLTPHQILDKVYENRIKPNQVAKPSPVGYLGDLFNPVVTRGEKRREDERRAKDSGQGTNEAVSKNETGESPVNPIEPMANMGNDEGVKAVEQSQPTNTEEAAQPNEKLTTKGITIADKAEGNIQDFGEKLEGAKKFTYTLKQAIEEKIDVSIVPLSKSFPQPDYEKLIASGVDPKVAALIAHLRAVIPTKPQKGYKLTRWATQVNSARGMAAGFYHNALINKYYPKIQIVCVDDIFNGVRLELPNVVKVLKKAEQHAEQASLF